MSEYRDILYQERDGTATITFNRPDRLNAFRVGMYEEVTDAILRAGWNSAIGVIVLQGAGQRAFGVGGDAADQKSERASRGPIGVPVDQLHAAIRDAPKPVIAKVRGYAIGGGNVLATLSDLTIAGESAIFWAGWTQGGLGRSRVRNRLSGENRRGEEGAGDLVFVPPLHRARSLADGAGQQGCAGCRT